METNLDSSTDYYHVPISESDDTQSFASHSDANDNIPSIIYTSDDSADVNPLNYTDCDLNLIADSVNQQMGDEISQQFLLESEQASPQLSPQPEDFLIVHPLSSIKYDPEVQLENKEFIDRKGLFVDSTLQTSSDLMRSTSSSSMGTESCPDMNPLFAEYEQLSFYPQDDPAFNGVLNFDVLQDDPVKTRVLDQNLNLMTSNDKGISSDITTNCKRWYVGNVHIDSDFKDAFFVHWNWTRIRALCTIFHVSFLITLLCAGVALLVQMPQGSECDPARQWWQGSVAYHIFVPSFQDSNGDGIGDIKGIISRLDYLSNLGVKVVRLAPIFESENFFNVPYSPVNFTSVMRSLGDKDDLHLLSLLLHERDMFLILDLPLSKGSNGVGSAESSETASSLDFFGDVPPILNNWTKLGVDGFVFQDLDKFAHRHDLFNAIQVWREALDVETNYSHRSYQRVMMVPLNLLQTLDGVLVEAQIQDLLSMVDLIDAQIGMSLSAEEIGSLIHDVSKWSSHPSHPWISWSLGGVGHPRLFEQMPTLDNTSLVHDLHVNTIGALLLQLYLPGSITLYYGDEIALCHPEEARFENFGWASLMLWDNQSKNGGFSSGEPWIPLSKNWKRKNVASLSNHLEPLRVMIKTAQREVPMYTNLISFREGQKQKPNYVVRMAKNNLLILERFYPRRRTFTIIINLGSKKEETDLSKFYFGCEILASSHGKKGYFYFKSVTLLPGEALACILDK